MWFLLGEVAVKWKEHQVNPACSFCGKSQHKVQKLIAGSAVFICNLCLELCFDLISRQSSVPQPAPSPRLLAKMARNLALDLKSAWKLAELEGPLPVPSWIFALCQLARQGARGTSGCRGILRAAKNTA